MTGTGRIQDRAAFDVLARALTRCRLDGISGALHLIGNPGGVFHLRKGIVVAVDSPGAPGADALLLRSGRVSEEDWTAALRAAAEGRSAQDELVARGSVGATELRVLSMMAARDAAFTTVAGLVEGYVIDREPVDVPLPLAFDVDAESLLQETDRRLNALASLPIPVAPHRERVAPVPGRQPPDSALTGLRREILAKANGRRTARDIAFLICRGVYPVTVEISRLLDEGLVEIPVQPPAPAPITGRAPIPRVRTAAPAAAPAPAPFPGPAGQTANLPARPRPGPSGAVAAAPGPPTPPIPQASPAGRTEPDGQDQADAPKHAAWHGLPRLFNLIRSRPGEHAQHEKGTP